MINSNLTILTILALVIRFVSYSEEICKIISSYIDNLNKLKDNQKTKYYVKNSKIYENSIFQSINSGYHFGGKNLVKSHFFNLIIK